MIKIALCLWLAWVTLAFAAPVPVKTGEHNGFTRLVIDYDEAVEWQVGRTDDGYELRVEGEQPEYDFTDSFKIIGTSRLVSLWADQDSGSLRIGVACQCHAIPFEFREGIVVIDLRNGPPPKGSLFEDRLPDLQPQAPLPDPVPARAAGPRYDWQLDTIAKLSGRQLMPAAQTTQPELVSPTALDALRDTLIGQISEGASQGLIKIAPLKLRKPEGIGLDSPSNPEIDQDAQLQDETKPVIDTAVSALRSSLRELPAISISKGEADHQNLGAKGETCLEAEALDFTAWRGDAPVADEMQRATQNIIGEFDLVDPKALTSAVQFYLSLGFGAEAKQLLKAFPSELPQVPMWQALADLVDGEAEPQAYFRGQMGCDTPAALWAILENRKVSKGDFVNRDAAYLAFSDLPIDLRRALGPSLTDRFLAMGDDVSVTRIRAAILRAPGEASPELTLMDASIDMHDGDPAAAEQKLQDMVNTPGPSSDDALVALIEAKVAQNLPVDKVLVDTLQSMVNERDNTAQAAPTRRALILAQAASGNFPVALQGAVEQPELERTVWRILARLGTDDAILSNAVLGDTGTIPLVDRETGLKLATRLFDLGLPEAARRWLQDETGIDPLLLAKIDLARQDANAALSLLSEQASPEALSLQAAALQKLGENAKAAKAFAESGDSVAALQASMHAQNWQDLRQKGTGNWQALAEVATTTEQASVLVTTPLAYGKDLLDQTAATRAAIQALLQQVTPP